MSSLLVSRSSIVSALRGAFVADAASMGTHWIYDPNEMSKSVPSIEEPEFKTPPTPNFYTSEEFPGHYGQGMLSPYGEQLLFVTEYLAKEGSVDGAQMSQAMLEWSESFGGRPDHALTSFQENMKAGKTFPDCGADDHQAHCYMKAVPVTCLFAGKPELADKVEEAIRVHQNNDDAVAYGLAASSVLETVLLGGTLEEALSKLEGAGKDKLEQTQKANYSDLETLMLEVSHKVMKDQPDSPFYDLAGRSCAMPGAFIAPIYLLDGKAADYAAGLRQNILGAGDTCSRAVFLGAVLGVTSGVPESWIAKVDKETMERIDAAINKIADMVVGDGGKEEL